MKQIVLMICLLSLGSCEREQWDDCFSSAGEENRQVRSLNDFDRVEISDNFTINLIQDSSREPYVEIAGPAYLLEGIQTEVNNGILTIGNRNICNFVRTYDVSFQLTINIRELKSITAIGNSVIRSADTLILKRLDLTQSATNEFDLILKANRVNIQTIDAGVFRLRGRAGTLNGSIERVSELDARDLTCDEVLMDSHTPLDIFINGQKVVFVKIFNSGNIYYKMSPSEKLELNERVGSGQLLLLE